MMTGLVDTSLLWSISYMSLHTLSLLDLRQYKLYYIWKHIVKKKKVPTWYSALDYSRDN